MEEELGAWRDDLLSYRKVVREAHLFAGRQGTNVFGASGICDTNRETEM